MSIVWAISFCAVLAALAAFQAVLILGAPLGRFAWGGQHDVLPRRLRIGSVVSIAIYAVFAAIVLDRAGMAAILPPGWSRTAIWILVAYFVLGVVMNAVSRSIPERNLMTPVAVILAVLCALVALG